MPAAEDIRTFPPSPPSEANASESTPLVQTLRSPPDPAGSSEATASNLATIMSIFRSFVGAGILSLPFAFSLVGIVVGPIGCLLVLGLLTLCCYQIVDAAKRLEDEFELTATDLGSCLEAALRVGPAWISDVVARRSKKFVQVIACIPQIIFAGPYLVFIAENVRYATGLNWRNRVLILSAFPIVAVLGSIRSNKFLSFISTVGNLVFVVGFFIVMQCIAQEPLRFQELTIIPSIIKIPKFIALVIYTYEGIVPLLHLRAKMRRPNEMLGFNGVLLTILHLIIIIYLAMAFLGYLKYGPDTAATITLNLPKEPLYDSLRIIFSLVLLTSFPVNMLPVVDIVFHKHLFDKLPVRFQQSPLLSEMTFRFLLVVLYFIPPIAYPSLGNLMALIGTVTGIPLAVVLPNVVQLLVRYPRRDFGPKRILLYFHLFVVVVAVCLVVIGVVVSVIDMINFYENEHF